IYRLDPTDRVLQFASFSFDTSVAEIFSTLSAGATLVLRPDEMRSPDRAFADFLRDQRITVADLPTAFWHQWTELPVTTGDDLANLRMVVVAGEKAELAALRKWRTRPLSSPSTWVNIYGPTEATVSATAAAFDRGIPLPEHSIPIGR